MVRGHSNRRRAADEQRKTTTAAGRTTVDQRVPPWSTAGFQEYKTYVKSRLRGKALLFEVPPGHHTLERIGCGAVGGFLTRKTPVEATKPSFCLFLAKEARRSPPAGHKQLHLLLAAGNLYTSEPAAARRVSY